MILQAGYPAATSMDSERLKRIEDIYHTVAEMPAGERHDYFAEVCINDENLRVEVESLLSYENISGSFIDTPPDDIAAEMFSDRDDTPPLIGQTIGHYKIKSLLGVGGMGEVYLADDELLNRKVALKLVWPGLAMQGDQLKRFKREAQASSALNHPNILTIHEFGTENGANYIVSEFVDGITLRKRMNDGVLSLKETLEIAVQAASALIAAHEAGIVHRDIKPENIMIRRDGIVKLLDFGLAKLTMPASQDPESNSDPQTLFKTAPGIIMGTANYMSPEQARGIAVDSRTDIWSLGVVIYEMFKGKVPFGGDTQTDVLVAILSEPVADTDILKEMPAPLMHLIEKALAKAVNERYQFIEELWSDLKIFKNRLEFEAELDRSRGDDQAVAALARKSTVTTAGTAATAGRGIATENDLIHATDSDTTQASKKSANFTYVAALVILTGVIGAFVWQYKRAETPGQLMTPPAVPAVQGVSESGSARTLAYSLTVQSYTDGRYKNPFALSGEMLFRNRDRVRLNLKSPQAGYLYIFNQGPDNVNSGRSYNILFPSPTANGGTALLPTGQEIQIPQQSWFELDAKEGTELVWLIWSEKAVPDLESAKRFANPTDRGRISDQQLNDEIDLLLQKYPPNKSKIERDDDKKESRITGNADIVTHTIKLEHH